MPVRDIRVLELNPVLVNLNGSGRRADIFTVSNDIRHQLTEDQGTETNPYYALKIEGIAEMFLNEPHKNIKGINQVSAHKFPVIIPLGVAPPQQGVEFVAGCNALDDRICPEHESRRQCIPNLPRKNITPDKSCNVQ